MENRWPHLQVNRRIFMPGEAHKANLALFLGLLQRFRSSALANEKIRIIFKRHAVDLPKVEMIGLEPAQGLFEHAQRQFLVASMRAHLCHQEDTVPNSLQ